jgi:putative ABC transport system substrate-binding protein
LCASALTRGSSPPERSSPAGASSLQHSRRATPFLPPYSNRDFAEAGGLMSYGTALADMFRHGAYTGRILKGAKPATCLSFTPPSSNSSSTCVPPRARLTVSPDLLSIADEVIE